MRQIYGKIYYGESQRKKVRANPGLVKGKGISCEQGCTAIPAGKETPTAGGHQNYEYPFSGGVVSKPGQTCKNCGKHALKVSGQLRFRERPSGKEVRGFSVRKRKIKGATFGILLRTRLIRRRKRLIAGSTLGGAWPMPGRPGKAVFSRLEKERTSKKRTYQEISLKHNG